MGKIKTVVMGDEVAEEAARKKAEAKREQKRAEKAATVAQKEARKTITPQIEEVSEEPKTAPVEETVSQEQPAEEVKEVKKAKKKVVESKYRFPTGKKYAEVKSLVDPKKVYSLSDAVTLVKKTSYSKFDGSVEVHLNVADKNMRGIVTFPHGTGKSIKVAIATDELIKQLESSPKIDFDILVASPEMMPKLARVAKILGPKGLMPNPKTGTIGPDPEKLAKDLSGGQTQWKTQPDFPIIHSVVGKVSFEDKKLEENLAALTKSIGRDKIVSAFIKATMGPSIKVQL